MCSLKVVIVTTIINCFRRLGLAVWRHFYPTTPPLPVHMKVGTRLTSLTQSRVTHYPTRAHPGYCAWRIGSPCPLPDRICGWEARRRGSSGERSEKGKPLCCNQVSDPNNSMNGILDQCQRCNSIIAKLHFILDGLRAPNHPDNVCVSCRSDRQIPLPNT